MKRFCHKVKKKLVTIVISVAKKVSSTRDTTITNVTSVPSEVKLI